MTMLLNMLLTNAIVVVPLAGFVWIVSRLLKRPALTHILWVLILLKLITPPFFRLPFSVTIPLAVGEVADDSVSSRLPMQQCVAPLPQIDGEFNAESMASIACESGTAAGLDTALTQSSSRQQVRSREDHLGSSFGVFARLNSRIRGALAPRAVIGALVAVWGFGSMLWFLRQFVSGLLFRRRIGRFTAVDEELQRHAQQLANRFGLRRCPHVILVNAQLSPMLWGYGSRIQLLFPADLAQRLDYEARGTLLAHELAHYSRGDHWIRLLELIVTGVFWWHPIVRLARHQIEESEEECCDAWVVTGMPHTPRRYAEALLDTIDFLCDSPKRLPPLASGLGPAAFLRKRLTKIMQGVSPKDLTARQRLAVLLIALIALPMQPFVFGLSSARQLSPTALGTAAPSPTPPIPPERTSVSGSRNVEEKQLPSSESSSVSAQATQARQRSNRSARGERIWGTAVSPNGHFAVQITTGRRVLLTNVVTGADFDLSTYGLTCVAFLPEGDSFIGASSDGHVTLWKASTGKMTGLLYIHDDVVRSVAVSPQGNVVAVGGRDGAVTLIDLASTQVLTKLPLNDSPVNCVRFSPDGGRLAVAVGAWNLQDSGRVTIWNLESGTVDSVLSCDSAPGAVSFVSMDELIVGQWDGHTSLWNLAKHHIVGSAKANKEIVNAASFSPDNPSLREVIFIPSGRATGTVAKNYFGQILRSVGPTFPTSP